MTKRRRLEDKFTTAFRLRLNEFIGNSDNENTTLVLQQFSSLNTQIGTVFVVLYNLLLRDYLIISANAIIKKSSKNTGDEMSRNQEMSDRSHLSRFESPRHLDTSRSYATEGDGKYSLANIKQFKQLQKAIYKMDLCRVVVQTIREYTIDTGRDIEDNGGDTSRRASMKVINLQRVGTSFGMVASTFKRLNTHRTGDKTERALKANKAMNSLSQRMKQHAKFDMQVSDHFLDHLIVSLAKHFQDN